VLLLTFKDKKVEEIVVEKIRKKYPDHSFVGEESVSMGHTEEVITDGPTWIIDRKFV
jgi:myo-inositol-1(or 4)-monophosphatase